jgi:hypothetical protein
LNKTEKNYVYEAVNYLALKIFYFKTKDIISTIFILPNPRVGLVYLLIFNFYKVFLKKDNNNNFKSSVI